MNTFQILSRNTTHTLSARHRDPILVTIELNKSKLQMEIDTGASRFIVGENTFKQLWAEELRPAITPAKVIQLYFKHTLVSSFLFWVWLL